MADACFRQCELEKAPAETGVTQVCWIPEKYAVMGRFVKLKDQGKWEDGWKVI
jgi:hypothetical protein